MSFARPDLLWLAAALPLLVGAGVLGYVRRRRRVARALGESPLVRRLGAADLDRFLTGRLVLLVLAAAALGAAAAGPRWGVRVVEGSSHARSVVLALDVSKSMLARDVSPDRLERQRLLARRLLRELRGDRLGIVVFAGRAYILSPLTVDHAALQLYIDALDPEIVSYGGSSLAAALRQATDLAQGQTAAAGDRAIVLVSDGEALEDEAGVLAEAARAAQAGIRVFTVGVGTPNGEPIPEREPATGRLLGYKRDAAGEIVISRLNESLLGQVAERTGGRFIRLDEAGATDRLLSGIRGIDRSMVDRGRHVQPRERFAWFVALALLLLAVDSLVHAGSRTPARIGTEAA